MISMRTLLTGLLITVISGFAFGQSALEVLNYSRLTPGGTARALGVAGAFGALGADQTAIGINPAGLGLYRHHELMGSLLINNTLTETNYNGSSVIDNRARAYIGQAGFVFSHLLDDKRVGAHGWKAANFAFTVSRLADFNTNRYMHNSKATNSFLAQFRNELNSAGLPESSINLNNFSGGVVSGYYTYLLNPADSGGTSYVSVTDGNFVDQQITTKTWGGINEIGFSLATNYKHKLYMGAFLGIPIINYHHELIVTERDVVDTIAAFNQYKYTNRLDATGGGVNLKLGIIYRPANFIRLGAAIHTPTFFGLSETYNTEIVSELDTLPYNIDSSTGSFEYNLKTPWRAVGSLALLFNKIGFASFDYEYTNYSLARYHFGSEYRLAEDGLNSEVKAILKYSHTYRFGIEVAPKKFRLRAGYAFSTSPLKDGVTISGDGDLRTQTFSGGIGYKAKVFYCDLTFYRTNTYATNFVASNIMSNDKIMSDNLVLSMGFTF